MTTFVFAIFLAITVAPVAAMAAPLSGAVLMSRLVDPSRRLSPDSARSLALVAAVLFLLSIMLGFISRGGFNDIVVNLWSVWVLSVVALHAVRTGSARSAAIFWWSWGLIAASLVLGVSLWRLVFG